MQGGIFINYRGDDSHSYGALLYRELSRRLGRNCVFLDSESIPAGTDFRIELLERVRGASVLLAVIGPSWLAATGPDGRRRIDDPQDWIRRELAEAFAAGVTVIPVLTDDSQLPGEEDLPTDIATLARRQYRMLRHRDVTADLARIRRDIAAAAPDLRQHRSTRPGQGPRPRPTLSRTVRVAAPASRPEPVPPAVPELGAPSGGAPAPAPATGAGEPGWRRAAGLLGPRTRLLFAAAAAALLVLGSFGVRPWRHGDSGSAGTPASADLASWHTGARCPAHGAVCFYRTPNYGELLGWFTPGACAGDYPVLWPYAAESIRNHSDCRVFLMVCPGDCWQQWLRPEAENSVLQPPDAVTRIRLTDDRGPVGPPTAGRIGQNPQGPPPWPPPPGGPGGPGGPPPPGCTVAPT